MTNSYTFWYILLYQILLYNIIILRIDNCLAIWYFFAKMDIVKASRIRTETFSFALLSSTPVFNSVLSHFNLIPSSMCSSLAIKFCCIFLPFPCIRKTLTTKSLQNRQSFRNLCTYIVNHFDQPYTLIQWLLRVIVWLKFINRFNLKSFTHPYTHCIPLNAEYRKECKQFRKFHLILFKDQRYRGVRSFFHYDLKIYLNLKSHW